MALAGSDLMDEAKAFCTPTGPRRAALVRRDAGLPPIEGYDVEPVHVFENLYLHRLAYRKYQRALES
jgi:hypothetical protein